MNVHRTRSLRRRRSAARRSCRPALRRRGAPATGVPSRAELARHVHQAAEIAGEQRRRAGGRDVRRSSCSTMALEISRILHAERAAEAAAHVAVMHLVQRQALRRSPAAGAAAPGRRARAGPSRNRDRSPRPRTRRRRAVDAEHVDQKLDQLVGLAPRAHRRAAASSASSAKSSG